MVTLFQTLHTLSFVAADRLKAVKEEKGASAVEYAILVAVLAAVVVAAVYLLGGKITALFNSVSFDNPGTKAS